MAFSPPLTSTPMFIGLSIPSIARMANEKNVRFAGRPRAALARVVGPERIPSGAEVRGGPVALEQPDDTGEADQEDGRGVEEELHVHVVLRHPHPQQRHHHAERDHREDDDADLPVLREDRARLAVAGEERRRLLGEVRHQDAGGHEDDRPRPPRNESGEEPPERAEHLVGPDVQRALLREHPPQLGRDERAGDEERREREDPEDEHRRPGELESRRVVDEQDDRDEYDHEVERPEGPRDQGRRDLLRDHGPFVVHGLQVAVRHASPPSARRRSPLRCGPGRERHPTARSESGGI